MRIAVYKPSLKIETGAAIQFSIGKKRRSEIPVMFIESVKQSKPKPPPGSSESPFNWRDDKITMMLNTDELGVLAACISGLDRKTLKFTHASELNGVKKTSVFEISPPMTDEQKKFGNWVIKMSTTVGDSNKYVQLFVEPGAIYRIKTLADNILEAYNLLPDAEID